MFRVPLLPPPFLPHCINNIQEYNQQTLIFPLSNLVLLYCVILVSHICEVLDYNLSVSRQLLLLMTVLTSICVEALVRT